MHELTAIPPPEAPLVDDHLIWDTWTSKYHLPAVAVAFSMEMLALRGKQYAVDELDQLLQEAGFTGTTITPTYVYYSLLSATKPT
jgi:hypothetical protein